MSFIRKYVNKQQDNTSKDMSKENILLIETKKVKAFQDEILKTINEHERLLHQEKKTMFIQTQQIEELESKIATASEKLDLGIFNKWETSRDISNLRDLLKDVSGTCSKVLEAINCCDDDTAKYKNNINQFRTYFNKFKLKLNDQTKSELDTIKNYENKIDNNKTMYKKDIADVNFSFERNKNEVDGEKEIFHSLTKQYDELSESYRDCESKSQFSFEQKKELFIEQQNKYAVKQTFQTEIKEINENLTAEVSNLNMLIENSKKKLISASEENEENKNLLVNLENENIDTLSKVQDMEDEIGSFQETSSELKAEQKVIEEKFVQDSKNIEYADTLNMTRVDKEQKYQETVLCKEASVKDLTTLNEGLQKQITENLIIEADLDGLKNTNNNKIKEVIHHQQLIEKISNNTMILNSDLLNIQKKLNETEIKICQQSVDNKYEKSNIENELQIIQENEQAITNRYIKQMSLYSTQLQKAMTEEDIKIDEKYTQASNKLQDIKKEMDVLHETNEFENDLQSKTLECDILIRKIKDLENSKQGLIKNKENADTIFQHPRVSKRRNFDEMSDSSVEGVMSVHDHLMMKRAREQRKMTKTSKKKSPTNMA